MAELEEKKFLTAPEIQESYERLSKNSDTMNENCRCGRQEHLIIEDAFFILGNTKKTGRQIGTMVDGVPLDWQKRLCEYDFVIVHWLTYSRDGHFTLFDKEGKEIFDPWCHVQVPLKKREPIRKLLYKIRSRREEV